MKKVIIVLLITVLVAGLAFAGTFTGYAGIDFGVDFDENEWGFANYVFGQYKFKFDLDTAKVAIGEDHKTDVWAELAAEASAWIGLAPGNGVDNRAANATAFHASYTAKITKANIHVGEDLVFGILDAGKAVDFAKTYYKVGGNQVSAVKREGTAPGFTVQYKDWKGGFGANGQWNEEDNADDNQYWIFAHAETPTFKFADDQLTVDAGVYSFLTDKNSAILLGGTMTNIGGAAKAAYKADKLSASLAADLKAILIPETAVSEKDTKFVFEVAANAAYDFVTLDVYVAPGALWGYEDDKDIKLDAKLAAKYTFNLNEDIALGVEGWVDARDTLINKLALEVGAIESTTIDAFTIKLTEIAKLANLANKDLDLVTDLSVEAYVGYEHEKFTAYADLLSKFKFDKVEDTKTFSNLYFECGISSEAIIEGAELSLVYGNNKLNSSYVDFLDLENHKGAVTASCIIYF